MAVIAVPELLYSAQLIYADNYETIPLLSTASLWYLILTTLLSIAQYFLERRYGRGVQRRARTSRPRTRVVGGVARRRRATDGGLDPGPRGP